MVSLGNRKNERWPVHWFHSCRHGCNQDQRFPPIYQPSPSTNHPHGNKIRHGQPGRLANGGLGTVLRVETHRARGRAAPGVAGSDAAREVRPGAPARPGGEFHAVLGAQGRAGEIHRAKSPIPRREQRHRLDARRAQAGSFVDEARRSDVALSARFCCQCGRPCHCDTRTGAAAAPRGIRRFPGCQRRR